jgi:hypothetical protein
MGPTTLFDKSFLQSLSVDESVFFDFYFIPAISPLFYVETLADLEKMVREGRTPEQEVGIIAQKTPELSGTPMPHHAEMGFVNQAKALSDSFVDGDYRKFDRMRLAGVLLGIPRHLERQLIERWSAYDYPRLREYAPYAAHIVTVELFFQIALGAKLISTGDANNRTDIAYLFYVPFCQLFVSSDRLHQRCAPLFLRDDQMFVWGPDLKADLARINKDILQLPEEEREKGLCKTVPRPPKQGLVRQLWERSFRQKEFDANEKSAVSDSRNDRRTGSDFKRFTDARPLKDHEINFDLQNPSVLAQAHNVHIRKGSHWQLPKGTKQQ